MKKGLLYFMSLFLANSTFGQINEQHNRIRIGDEIVKQQVEFKEPGEAGVNQLWDFSKLKTINDSYSLTYSLPTLQADSLYIMGYDTFAKKDIADDELIVGTEHNTMYYYRLKDNILYLLGHENPSVKLQYTEPVPVMYYPISFNEPEKGMVYTSKGLYSSTIKMSTGGTSGIVADAFGKMILPRGDTISPVLRLKTIKTIGDNPQGSQDKD